MSRTSVARFVTDWNCSYNEAMMERYDDSGEIAAADKDTRKLELINSIRKLELPPEVLVTKEGNLLIKAKELAMSETPENMDEIRYLMTRAEHLILYADMM